jgi:hypothetical protein
VDIAPLVQKIGATSIAEVEKMIGELQTAKDFLESEGERVQREAEHYTTLTQETIRDPPNSISRSPQPRTTALPRACRSSISRSPRDRSKPGPEGSNPLKQHRARNSRRPCRCCAPVSLLLADVDELTGEEHDWNPINYDEEVQPFPIKRSSLKRFPVLAFEASDADFIAENLNSVIQSCQNR